MIFELNLIAVRMQVNIRGTEVYTVWQIALANGKDRFQSYRI